MNEDGNEEEYCPHCAGTLHSIRVAPSISGTVNITNIDICDSSNTDTRFLTRAISKWREHAAAAATLISRSRDTLQHCVLPV